MLKITPDYLASQGLSNDFPDRFFAKVNITPSCWLWTGYRRKTGQAYGELSRGRRVRGHYVLLAHRASWMLHFGPIPEGIGVLHDCPDGDCPYCVNPAHLWLGTDSENAKDMWRKGRANIVTDTLGGERNHLALLTDKEADEIRKAYTPKWTAAAELASRFGVPKWVIKRILSAKTYRNTGAKPFVFPLHKLSEEQEDHVRKWYALGSVSQEKIADYYSVSQKHISNVIRNKYPLTSPARKNNL